MTADCFADGLPRCGWPGLSDPLYTTYHDTEWGVPQTDGAKLFEKMVLEGFQSGLSWLTILRKRETFRTAFAGFDIEAMARFDEHDVARLMGDPGIVRNRAKIEAAIGNARACIELGGTAAFADLVWSIVDYRPLINTQNAHSAIPAETERSKALSKALKARGFRFVGPTTLYAFMQSVGMVNDHLVSCHRRAPCAEAMAAFAWPGAAGSNR